MSYNLSKSWSRINKFTIAESIAWIEDRDQNEKHSKIFTNAVMKFNAQI